MDEAQIKELAGVVDKNKTADPEELKAAIGNNVREYRKYHGATQYDLAEATGLTRVTINNVENGKNLSVHTLYVIARSLGVTPNDLFPDYEDMEAAK